MNLAKLPPYLYRLLRKRPAARYAHLYRTILHNRSRQILEIGVYDGLNAKAMIDTALIRALPSEIFYYGFDLFGNFDDAELRHEFSQQPESEAEILSKLASTRANVALYKGHTRETLPTFVRQCHEQDLFMDLIYIDGGHHIDTVRQDWLASRELMNEHTVVIFDDYFTEPDPSLGDVGCQKLIDSLEQTTFDVQILLPQDTYPKEWGLLKTNFVRVRLKSRR